MRKEVIESTRHEVETNLVSSINEREYKILIASFRNKVGSAVLEHMRLT